MKVLIIILLGVIIYQSEDSRYVISDGLQSASEMIRPDPSIRARF